MVVTVTSMKGGVGKTTIVAMIARYLADRDDLKIIVIDMDPQGGASSILLGGQINSPTVVDILRLEVEGIPSGELMSEATRRSRYDERIFVVPGDADLATLANSNPPQHSLDYALEDPRFNDDTLVIVDTGTHPVLVAMGIIAADIILIPIMLSQQTAKPTINTLKMVLCHHQRNGALIPMGIGNANWEARELERWQRKLQASQALTVMGFEVLPGLPYSRTILRGRWRYGKFPKRFLATMDGICQFIFQRSSERAGARGDFKILTVDRDEMVSREDSRSNELAEALHHSIEAKNVR